MKGRIICICGPTAAGKSALAVALARHYGGEVVSADSMQIYRGLDVGTAKTPPEERQGVPHHMIDVASPEESWSVARFTQAASEAVDGVLARGALPIVCGGTGLYVESLIKGLDFSPAPGDDAIRERYAQLAEMEGREALYALLEKRDPEAAAKLHPNDLKRVIRALEVLELTGQSICRHDADTALQPPRYEALKIVLTFADRQALYRRIEARVEQMVSNGLLEETRKLVEMALPPGSTALQAIGYKEMIPAVRGERSLAECIGDLKQATRRYAKRQLTWFRRWQDAKWLIQEKETDFDALFQDSTRLLKDFGVI